MPEILKALIRIKARELGSSFTLSKPITGYQGSIDIGAWVCCVIQVCKRIEGLCLSTAFGFCLVLTVCHPFFPRCIKQSDRISSASPAKYAFSSFRLVRKAV